MIKKLKLTNTLNLIIIISLLITTIIGLLAFPSNNNYTVLNQYGDVIDIFGNGIYKHDSAFKAPILIGSDFTMLVFILPIFIYSCVLNLKHNNIKTNLFLASILGTILYYSFSIVFGVTYNYLYLVYIILFSSSFFSLFISIRNLAKISFSSNVFDNLLTKRLKVFLIICSLSLFIAWLPDIIKSLVLGTSLDFIGIYTTEITYGLDMAIISPMFLYIIYLFKKHDSLGIILMAILLTLGTSIGIMVPFQTIFQVLSGIVLPIEALITKVLIFMILSIISLIFLRKLYKSLN